MILILDNYDSFTWNLYHYVEQLSNEQIVVKRNDEISIGEVAAFNNIILSPGPGLPAASGIMNEIIRVYSPKIPILGICLGHQAIAEVYGAELENLDTVWHGVERKLEIIDSEDRLFKGLPQYIKSGHYHSWVVKKNSLPSHFNITAEDETGTIMAISHKHFPLSGVQFHPESIMTQYGPDIMQNWLRFVDTFPNASNN